MGNPQTMMSDKRLPVGVTILDSGTPPAPFASIEELPEGSIVTIESSDPDIVGVEMHADGLHADLTSDGIGTSTITISALRPDGSHLANSPSVTEVTVTHAQPGSINVAFGAPEPE